MAYIRKSNNYRSFRRKKNTALEKLVKIETIRFEEQNPHIHEIEIYGGMNERVSQLKRVLQKAGYRIIEIRRKQDGTRNKYHYVLKVSAPPPPEPTPVFTDPNGKKTEG